MRKLSKKISMLMVLAMLVGLFSGVVSASAASAWSFGSSKYAVAVNGSINMESKEYADFDLLKDGKEAAGYTVAWASSDEDVVWVNAKTGQLRADKFGVAEDGDKAVISATFTNNATKKSATRSFTIVLGAAKADFTVEAADATIALGEEVKFAPVVKNADGKAVKFATHKSYNGYFLDGKAIANPWTPEEAGEYTVTIAQFAKKADVADLAKAVRKTDVKVTVTVDAEFDAKATKVKEITVYGDFAKDATFTVKKGTVAIAVANTAVAENGKSAILTLDNKLTKGTYTVACGDAKVDLVIEDDEKVASIVILDDGGIVNVSADRKVAYVYYDMFNQYNESVRKSFSVDNWVASTSTEVHSDRNTGLLEIPVDDWADLETTDKTFTYGQTIIITGIHTSVGNVATVNASVTAGLEQRVNSVEIVGFTKKDSGKLVDALPTNFKDNEYYLVFKLFDQMGYQMDYEDAEGNAYAEEVAFTSLSPLLIGSTFALANDTVIIDGEEYAAVALTRGLQTNQGGIAKIQVTSKQTGVTKVHEINLPAEQVLTTFKMIAPDILIAEGDSTSNGNYRVTIPYEAYDQNGMAITSYRALYGKVTFGGDASLYFKENNDGSASLLYKVPASVGASKNVDIQRVYTSTVTDTGSVSNITISVKDMAVPTTVKGYGAGIANTVVEGDFFELKAEDQSKFMKFYDQYDREMSEDTAKYFFGGDAPYYVGVKAISDNVTLTSAYGTVNGYTLFNNVQDKQVKITAGADVTDATSQISLEYVIFNPSKELVDGSDKKLGGKIVDIKQVRNFSISYENKPNSSEANSKLYWNADEELMYSATIKVNGTLADGTSVRIPVNNGNDGADYLNIAITGTNAAKVVTGSAWDNFTAAPTGFAAGDFVDHSATNPWGGNPNRLLNFGVAIAVNALDYVDGAWTAALRDNLYTEISVGADAPQYVTINPKSWMVNGDQATLSADNGTIHYWDLSDFIINYVDSYGRTYGTSWYHWVPGNMTITISKYVESENGLYSGLVDEYPLQIAVGSTNEGVPMIQNAEIGDTFTATYTIDGNPAKFVLNFTVGADKQAFFPDGSDIFR